MRETIEVSVAKDLEDLIPGFMKNRLAELDTLRAALAGGDMEQLRQLGHRMKGVGNSYGFEGVSRIGKQLEDRVQAGDLAGLAACLADYADYLERVHVSYE